MYSIIYIANNGIDSPGTRLKDIAKIKSPTIKELPSDKWIRIQSPIIASAIIQFNIYTRLSTFFPYENRIRKNLCKDFVKTR